MNLSTEQNNKLLDVLTSIVIKLDRDNDRLRDKLEFYRSKNEELKLENKKLQRTNNVLYHNQIKQHSIPF